MDTRHLIDAIVVQTTILIAELATTAGIHAPLARIADQVFLDLFRAVEAKAVGRKVVADMFGLALRTYRKKVNRLSECVAVIEGGLKKNRYITTLIIPFGFLLLVCWGKDNEDNAETIDSGAVDGVTPDGDITETYEPAYQPAELSDGQMELPVPTGRYRVGLSERLMTPGGGVPNESDAPIATFTSYYTRIFFPVDPAYSGETLRFNSALFWTSAELVMSGIPGFSTCGTSEQIFTHTYLDAESL